MGNVVDVAAWTQRMIDVHDLRPALLFIGGDWNNRPTYETLGGDDCEEDWKHAFSTDVDEGAFRKNMNLDVISMAFGNLSKAYVLDGPRVQTLDGKMYLPTYKYYANGEGDATSEDLNAKFNLTK